jgi:hypothetical protein
MQRKVAHDFRYEGMILLLSDNNKDGVTVQNKRVQHCSHLGTGVEQSMKTNDSSSVYSVNFVFHETEIISVIKEIK